MIKLENVTKKFSKKTIIDNLSIDINKSIIYGLLGPNGAGKTTTIRLLCGIIEPTSGKRVLYGNGVGLKKKIGYMPEEIGLYRDMTIEEEILYFAKLYKLTEKQALSVANPLIYKFNLENQLKKKIGTLSKGNVRKIQFICTLIHSPKLIILDEPFSGLDPESSAVLEREIIRLKNEGNTIILSTHIMEHADIFCDHVFIINQGKKIIDGSYNYIKDNFSNDNYVLHAGEKITSKFQQKYNINKLAGSNDNLYNISMSSEDDLNRFLNAFLLNNHSIKSLVKEEFKLRKFFLDQTKTN